MTVLVITAHPDDECLGMGGTIAKLANQKHHVCVFTVGDGVAGTRAPVNDCAKERDQRRRQWVKACQILGAEPMGFPPAGEPIDQRFDGVDLCELVDRVDDVVGFLRPDAIYTHAHGDLNLDHELTTRAVLTACRKPQSVPQIYGFPVLSSYRTRPLRVTTYVDIQKTLKKKCQAVAVYADEVKAMPWLRSKRAIQLEASRYRQESGYEASEAFELLRELR